MLRVSSAASCPSARNHFACGRTPTSRKSVASAHAGPLAVAGQGSELLRRDLGGGRAAAEVSGALEEVDAADRGKALEIGEREHHRPLDHPVDQQRVALRIDLGNAAVMPLEVQVGRRDRAVQILMRRAGRRDAAHLALRFLGRRALAERPAWLAAHLGGVGRSLRRSGRRGLAERDDAGGAGQEMRRETFIGTSPRFRAASPAVGRPEGLRYERPRSLRARRRSVRS